MELLLRELVVLPIPFLVALVLVLVFGRWRRSSRVMIALITIGFWIAAMPQVGDWLAHRLARAVPEVGSGEPGFDFVVVPTAGHFEAGELGFWPARGSLRRYAEGIAVARELSVPLIVSGGDPAGIGSSEAAALVLRSPPPPDVELIVEPSARNTAATAAMVGRVRAGGSSARLALVTSCAHTLRTAALLHAQGFEVRRAGRLCQRSTPHAWHALLPTGEGLSLTAEATHEFVGIAWALLRGEISFEDLDLD